MAEKLSRTQGGWIPVTKSKPCEVCEKPDWCTVNHVARLSCCMRVESDKPAANGGWMHRSGNEPITLRTLPPTRKRLPERERIKKWTAVARHLHASRGENVKRLAEQLGVATGALDVLEVGYGTCAGRLCWSFPERNEHGAVVGISRRLVTPCDGRNKMSIGGRGLTYPPGMPWRRPGEPVLIVEGGSDTAAGITLGRATIGRPSCNGGLRHLVPMLRTLTAPRRIIVVAERDKRPHADGTKCPGCLLCWPGKAGAKHIQQELSRQLKQRVVLMFPPDNAKDLRSWLNAQNADVESPGETFELGKRLFA